MCKIFATITPDQCTRVARSLRVGGQVTSIRLEQIFWNLLDEMAEREGRTTAKFVNELHDEIFEEYGYITNFTSLLRIACLRYISDPDSATTMVSSSPRPERAAQKTVS